MEVVRLFLAYPDININLANSNEQTPLLLAAREGHMKVVRLLLVHPDIDVNCKTKQGKTPLFIAASRGYYELVNLFLACHNVQVDSKDNFERTFLSWATDCGDEKVVGQIFKRFANLEYPKDDAYRCSKFDAYSRCYWIIRHVLARFDE